VAVLAVSIALVGAVAEATAQTCDCAPYTFMVSASSTGGVPNGPSRNAAISHDQRIASVVAFESDASNILPGDTNGLTDVFVALRAKPWGINGTRWRMGQRRLISRSPNGSPANGPSYKPAASGNSEVAPKCVAFVSEASNLVSGDTNNRADAFVYYVATGAIRRVSVSSSGRQSNGRTYDVSVDGRCERFSFTSDATNLALTNTSRSQWKSAVTYRAPAGTKQVYSRFVAEPKYSDGGLRGLTFLASATNRRPGNGDSYQTTMPSRRGDAVGFTSKATNLSSADRSAIPDVYWRKMPLVRVSGGLSPRFTTHLISRSRAGTGGNGPSSAPVASGNHYDSSSGSNIAYQTESTNVGGAFTDRNGVTDVVRSNIKGGRVSSRYLSNGQSCNRLGNAASQRPTISEAGTTVMYDSDASNFTCYSSGADRNGSIADVFTWTERRLGSILFSFDSLKKPLSFDSRNPATSARINYYLWETRDPFTDTALARRSGFGDDPAAVRAQAAEDERFSQVYMRYGGPQ
jgi:hypothetical protein